MKRHIIFFIIILSSQSIQAQIFLDVGTGFSGTRNDALLVGDILLRPNFQTGISYSRVINPAGGNDLFFQFGMQFVMKGFIQRIEEIDYRNRFYYLSFPITLRYTISDAIAIDVGVEANGLMSATQNSANRAVADTQNSYAPFDMSGRLRLGIVPTERLQPYLQVSYGFTPIVSYRRFDDFGAELEPVDVLSHMVYSFGLRINIFDK